MEKNLYEVKSPLRYPGGKSRALKKILPIIFHVSDFDEFREPMVGGGSVFFAVKQTFPNKKYWINDINKDLCHFYEIYENKPTKLIKEIKKIKSISLNGKELYYKLINENGNNALQKAARFFVLNRITFSGLTEAGGYSEEAYMKRFTPSSVERLIKAAPLMKKVKITNKDYAYVIRKKGKKVFIFLDPPYMSNSKSKLYGKRGCFHEGFDHQTFRDEMKKCKHKWLITYDDTQKIRQMYSFANIYKYRWNLQYAMNNHNGKTPTKGKELFICNFKIPKEIRRLFVQL